MTTGFPWAQFGKPAGAAHDPFQVVHRSAEFPSEALAAFDELTRSVRWKSDGVGKVYPSLTALWPMPGQTGLLIARIEDSGSDASGRPHVLGVRCVYLNDGDHKINADSLAKVLNAEWPDVSLASPPALLSLTPATGQLDTQKQLLSDFRERHRRWPRLLCGSRRSLEAANFELFHDSSIEDPAPQLIAPAIVHSARTSSEIMNPARRGFGATVSTSIPWHLVAGALGILLCVAMGIFWWEQSDLRAHQSAVEKELDALQARLDLEQQESQRRQAEVTLLRQERIRLEEQAQAEKADFEKWREASRRHGIADLPDLEARLRAFDQKSTPAVRNREQQLKQLSPIKRALSELQGNIDKLHKSVQNLEDENSAH